MFGKSLIITFFISALFVTAPVSAQTVVEQYDSTAIGFTLNGGNSTFSDGITVTSPWLIGSRLAVQATGLQSWFTHGIDEDKGEETWVPFTTYRLGLMGGSLTANGFMRMYGAGGILVFLPNKKFSDEKTITGSYGMFGFEFISGRSLNYYIELGANGISANADKIPGKPNYGNGFSSTVGFRYYL